MTESEQTIVLNRVFAIIGERAAALRKNGDFYEGSYCAGELDTLPGYIIPRLQGPESYALHVAGIRSLIEALRARCRDIDVEIELQAEEGRRPEPDRRAAAAAAMDSLWDEYFQAIDDIERMEGDLARAGEKVSHAA